MGLQWNNGFQAWWWLCRGSMHTIYHYVELESLWGWWSEWLGEQRQSRYRFKIGFITTYYQQLRLNINVKSFGYSMSTYYQCLVDLVSMSTVLAILCQPFTHASLIYMPSNLEWKLAFIEDFKGFEHTFHLCIIVLYKFQLIIL